MCFLTFLLNRTLVCLIIHHSLAASVRESTKFVKISKSTHHVNDAHLFVVSSINKTSIITNVSIKFISPVRRKSSKLFQRRRYEESLRTTAVTCLGLLGLIGKLVWVRFLKKVKIYHLSNSRNKQAKKTFSMTITTRNSRKRRCWSKWFLEINRQTYDQTLVVQTETIVSF